jgi:hypothetical protein
MNGADISRLGSRLKAGGFLVICETPNRLWWYDSHTSRLPFFNWLPDDLAIEYSARSSRPEFRELHDRPIDDQTRLVLSRWGRGASYHEMELCIPEFQQVAVFSMNAWVRKRNPVQLEHFQDD